MGNGDKEYIWTVGEVIDLNSQLTSIQNDISHIREAVDKSKKPHYEQKKSIDTFTDWKTLVIASLTIIGAIIAITQG